MVDFIEPAAMVLSVIKEIYTIVEKVQSFKQRSRTLKQRIEALMPAIEKLATSENNEIVGKYARDDQGIKLFSRALGDLLKLVQRIQDFLETLTEKSFIKKLRHENKIGTQFDEFSGQLDALVKNTHFNLQVEMREVLFNRLEKDKEDQKKDVEYLLAIIESLEKLKSGQEEIIKQIKEKYAKLSANLDKYFDHGPADEAKEIELSQLENRTEIATGYFGTVYKALYMKDPVALKVFPTGVNLNKDVLLKEAKNLIHLDSKHVVRIWGVCTTTEPYMIVQEYMELGNLRHVLDTTDPSQLPCDRRIQMALDGALGLYRIHHMPRAMLHLDLASHKFLVNANWEVKITDVGLAKTRTFIRKQSKQLISPSTSTKHYLSPEQIECVNQKPEESMEVYSYGIIMWEIATGLKPYEGKGFKEIKNFVLEKKEKLSFPPTVTNEGFKELIDKCRNFLSLDRPTSGEIVDTLQGLRCAICASDGVSWM